MKQTVKRSKVRRVSLLAGVCSFVMIPGFVGTGFAQQAAQQTAATTTPEALPASEHHVMTADPNAPVQTRTAMTYVNPPAKATANATATVRITPGGLSSETPAAGSPQAR